MFVYVYQHCSGPGCSRLSAGRIVFCCVWLFLSPLGHYLVSQKLLTAPPPKRDNLLTVVKFYWLLYVRFFFPIKAKFSIQNLDATSPLPTSGSCGLFHLCFYSIVLKKVAVTSQEKYVCLYFVWILKSGA